MNNAILSLLIIDLIVLVGLIVAYCRISSEAKHTSALIMRLLIGTGIIGLGLGTFYYLY